MEKFIELELTLMNGDEYYICDRSFSVMREHRNRVVDGAKRATQIVDACAVNGYAVMETYSEVIAMIRKAKGVK
tara:strand:+ start:50 stop:271 length:222 start_codon:yes stop_codon:yes gene_type:complete